MTAIKDIFNTVDYDPASESADAAQVWLSRHKGRFDLFIGGRFVKAKSGERFASRVSYGVKIFFHLFKVRQPCGSVRANHFESKCIE